MLPAQCTTTVFVRLDRYLSLPFYIPALLLYTYFKRTIVTIKCATTGFVLESKYKILLTLVTSLVHITKKFASKCQHGISMSVVSRQLIG